MDISFNPPPDRDDRRSMRAMVPRLRRAVAWIADFHKFVITLAGIATATVGAHVFLKGLITRKELDLAVESAVTKALADVRADLAIIKTNTGGIPEWRGDMTTRVISLEQRISIAHKLAEKNESRIDTYLTTRVGR
jgi:hypothetical protein